MAKTYANCTCCNRPFPVNEMVGTAMPNRGNRLAYMCVRCTEQNRPYHANNGVMQGKEKQNKVFVGIEHETSFSDEYARNIMFEYDFIPTHDSSLRSDSFDNRYGIDGTTCEYVSGIMQGLNIASKWAVTVEKLISEGHMQINSSCGTHTHISIDSMKDANGEKTYMGYISRFYHSLFVPLCKAMQENPEKTAQLFGRYFDYHYCSSITEDTYENDRFNFINVTNNSNIEFRLNKFVNAKQYQNLIKMEVEMVKTIVTNFCEHFNDTPNDARRYPTKTAYRKHKAQVTAQKLVKIYEKYSANI